MKYKLLFFWLITVVICTLDITKKCKCSDLRYKKNCQQANCQWNGSYCSAFPNKKTENTQNNNGNPTQFEKCSDYEETNICEQYGCIYSDGICNAPTCSSLTYSSCTHIRGNDYEERQVCTWDDNSRNCITINDYSVFNSYYCFQMTLGTYEWKDNSCQACYLNNSENLELIVGLSVSLPILFVILGIIIFYIIKKNRRIKQQYIIDVHKASKISNILNEDQNKSCFICFQNFDKTSTIITTQCEHIFHSQCLMEWINSNKICPICKKLFLNK